MTRGPYSVPRIGRAVIGLISQETALTNAAEASAKLRQRRRERQEVDAYLSVLHSPIAEDTR
jgi:hypothetical protein